MFELKEKDHESSRAENLQLDLWLEPARLRLITTNEGILRIFGHTKAPQVNLEKARYFDLSSDGGNGSSGGGSGGGGSDGGGSGGGAPLCYDCQNLN